MDFLNKTLTNIDIGSLFNDISSPNQYANISCVKLGKGRRWKHFLFCSLVSPVITYSILAIWTLIKWIALRSKRAITGNPNSVLLPEYIFGPATNSPTGQWSIPGYERLQKEVNKVVCCQNVIGEIIAVIAFLVAMVSFGIYVYEVSNLMPDLETCRNWTDSLEWQIDFACNVFFVLYFFLRLIASNRKVWFLSEMYTIIDYFTIPNAFVALIMSRNWSGLRFLRILHIFSIPEVLQFVGFLKGRAEVRLARLVCQLAGVVFVGAGVFHLLENFPDVHTDSDGTPSHSYGKYLYFTMITISTVGYGDIYPTSALGRVFCCFFIMAALGVFASSIPDIVHIVSLRYKYGGKFKLERGSHHVIVCGHIDSGIAIQILENCFHSDNEVKNLNIVFLSPADPDLEMEALLKKNFTQVDYLQGDVLNSSDLQRAQIRDAFACVIIANKKPERADTEDALNVMRAISVKKVQPMTRVIVQLLHSRHQMQLLNLSVWNTFRGDTIINLSFLKMELLAKSCEAFGFSTLVSNLLNCYSVSYRIPASSTKSEKEVFDYYKSGTTCRISFHVLSDFYTGMTFQSAARHAYSTLDLLLIGLFERPIFAGSSVTGSGEILINPTKTIISPEHIGIFVTRIEAEGNKAWYFCKSCHIDVKNSSEIKMCRCHNKKIGLNSVAEVNPVRRFWSNSQRGVGCKKTAGKIDTKAPENPYRKVPSLDSFVDMLPHYWMSENSFSIALLNTEGGSQRLLENHIVFCVISEADAVLMPIYELVAPLRSRSIPYEQLKDIVLFGDPDYFERQWDMLRLYPRLYVAKGNAVDWDDLQAASIKTCSVCVIVAAKRDTRSDGSTDEAVDYNSILATWNLKASQQGFHAADGKNPIPHADRNRLKIITTLEHDESIRFLEQEDLVANTQRPIGCSQPYMAGEVIMDSVLDLLTASSYFNPLTVPLIQSFIFGRAFIQRDRHHDEPLPNATSFRVIPLGESIFTGFTNGTYKELLLLASHHGVICIGLHRMYGDPESDLPLATKRCVITAPPGDLTLQPDDLVFVFAPRDDYNMRSDQNDSKVGTKISLDILDQLSDVLENDRNIYSDGLSAKAEAQEKLLKTDFALGSRPGSAAGEKN